MYRLLLLLTLSCLVVASPIFRSASQGQNSKAKEFRPTAEWTGAFPDDDLKVLAPSKRYINNEKDWEKLWKAWRGDKQKVPQVNFKENLVIVQTSRYRAIKLGFVLDTKGNLKSTGTTYTGGEKDNGFTYAIGVIPREGIKSVFGKPLEGEK